MSSPFDEGPVSVDNHDIVTQREDRDEQAEGASDGGREPDYFSRTKSPDEEVLGSGSGSPALGLNGTTFQGYGRVLKNTDTVPDSPNLTPLEGETASEELASPGESGSTLETPDDTPSIKVNRYKFIL